MIFYRTACRVENYASVGVCNYLIANNVPGVVFTRGNQTQPTARVLVFADSAGVRSRLPHPENGVAVDASWNLKISLVVETQRTADESLHNSLVGDCRFFMLDQILARYSTVEQFAPFELQRVEEIGSERHLDTERNIDSTQLTFNAATILDLTQTTF